jgi:predicted nucleic acid-binding protein
MDYTLDACALIALVNKESEAGMVDELIQKAVVGDAALNMSIINLTEVYYGYLHDRGKEEADRILNRILSYPIRVINVVTDAVFRQAAYYKATYAVSLADAYACATAWWTRSTLVTKDHEIKAVEENENLSVYWIRPAPEK